MQPQHVLYIMLFSRIVRTDFGSWSSFWTAPWTCRKRWVYMIQTDGRRLYRPDVSQRETYAFFETRLHCTPSLAAAGLILFEGDTSALYSFTSCRWPNHVRGYCSRIVQSAFLLVNYTTLNFLKSLSARRVSERTSAEIRICGVGKTPLRCGSEFPRRKVPKI